MFVSPSQGSLTCSKELLTALFCTHEQLARDALVNSEKRNDPLSSLAGSSVAIQASFLDLDSSDAYNINTQLNSTQIQWHYCRFSDTEWKSAKWREFQMHWVSSGSHKIPFSTENDIRRGKHVNLLIWIHHALETLSPPFIFRRGETDCTVF